MKSLILTAIFAAAPLVHADISYGKQPAAPTAEEYTGLANEVITVLKELTGVLGTVKDKASADAAAPQLSGITQRMLELQRKAEGMPRPSNEVEQLVRGSINVQEIQQLVNDFLNTFIQIAMNNAYGSQALMDAMGPVMNGVSSMQE